MYPVNDRGNLSPEPVENMSKIVTGETIFEHIRRKARNFPVFDKLKTLESESFTPTNELIITENWSEFNSAAFDMSKGSNSNQVLRDTVIILDSEHSEMGDDVGAKEDSDTTLKSIKMPSLDIPSVKKEPKFADTGNLIESSGKKPVLSQSIRKAVLFIGNSSGFALTLRYQGRMDAAHKIGHAAYHGPSVVKEIIYGVTLGLMAGGLWKMHHWNYQRRTKEFYDLLEKGVSSVVVEDEYRNDALTAHGDALDSPAKEKAANRGVYNGRSLLPAVAFGSCSVAPGSIFFSLYAFSASYFGSLRDLVLGWVGTLTILLLPILHLGVATQCLSTHGNKILSRENCVEKVTDSSQTQFHV
ncbi:hypothetical protein F0562_004608 [Nyssa sinensis]|uniref:Cytochrome c oxidase subunit 5C n=1 Tax=Nyssa sinensis TaxID=561372 RepID=A0A5J5C3H0_9ASTE|nr:hypothetical protein F0562_004608 [Nyssa sinensis]